MKKKSYVIRSIILSVWVLFTISLAGWWFVFGERQLNRLMSLQHQEAAQSVRYHKMLMWEGGALLLSLLGGGAALGFFMMREIRQREAISTFLATLTHELKTPLASLQLQAEILREQIQNPDSTQTIERLVGDTARLTLQLDNCLALAGSSSFTLLPETLSLRDVLRSFEGHWPGLTIELVQDAYVHADRRALASILQNLIQNSVVHGKASRVTISIVADRACVDILVQDNGRGFEGRPELLGKLFQRFYSGSGSGIGLYLARRMAQRMSGDLSILSVSEGFCVKVRLRGTAA